MKSSDQIGEIAEALSLFQGAMPIVPKSHTAKIPTKSGGEYSYNYADLGDVVEAAKPHLAENGLSVTQMPGYEEGKDVLTTRIMHKSGQWIEDTMRLIVPSEAPQVFGSSVTYFKRYAFCAALSIVADTDDDGSLAQVAYGENATRRRKPPKGSTPTDRRPIRAVPPGSPGTAGTTASQRNKIVSHFAHLLEPITGDGVLAKVNDLLGKSEEDKLKTLSDLTASDAAELFVTLDIHS